MSVTVTHRIIRFIADRVGPWFLVVAGVGTLPLYWLLNAIPTLFPPLSPYVNKPELVPLIGLLCLLSTTLGLERLLILGRIENSLAEVKEQLDGVPGFLSSVADARFIDDFDEIFRSTIPLVRSANKEILVASNIHATIAPSYWVDAVTEHLLRAKQDHMAVDYTIKLFLDGSKTNPADIERMRARMDSYARLGLGPHVRWRFVQSVSNQGMETMIIDRKHVALRACRKPGVHRDGNFSLVIENNLRFGDAMADWYHGLGDGVGFPEVETMGQALSRAKGARKPAAEAADLGAPD